jgi:transposase
MKRGRPSKRFEVQNLILETLHEIKTPVSTNAIRNIITKKIGKEISWNTVNKYLQELVKIDKVKEIPTPHSKKEGKKGLTVYILKR